MFLKHLYAPDRVTDTKLLLRRTGRILYKNKKKKCLRQTRKNFFTFEILPEKNRYRNVLSGKTICLHEGRFKITRRERQTIIFTIVSF